MEKKQSRPYGDCAERQGREGLYELGVGSKVDEIRIFESGGEGRKEESSLDLLLSTLSLPFPLSTLFPPRCRYSECVLSQLKQWGLRRKGGERRRGGGKKEGRKIPPAAAHA